MVSQSCSKAVWPARPAVSTPGWAPPGMEVNRTFLSKLFSGLSGKWTLLSVIAGA